MLRGINFNIQNSQSFRRALLWALFILIPTSQNCSHQSVQSRYSNLLCADIDDPDLAPVEEYRWNHALSPASEWNQVMSTPVVGDLDGDSLPEIVFVSYNGNPHTIQNTYTGQGVLRILSGRDGSHIRSVTEAVLAPIGATTPLLIDIDHDGTSEIIYMHYNLKKVIALNFNGAPRWSYELPTALRSCFGGLSAADLNGDGTAEIIVENTVLSEIASKDAVLAKELSEDVSGTSCTSFAMSLDPHEPQQMQIINGKGVYKANGEPLWSFPSSDQPSHRLFLAAGDIRSDIEGIEVVGVDLGFVTLYNGLTGQVLWTIQTPTDPDRFNGMSGRGGPPNIADFDGDEKPDIGVANAVFYAVFDGRGQLKWSQPNHDYSSNVTGSMVFDFNGDGIGEVLYADEGYLKIFNGPTGTTLAKIPNPSHTLLESPVVADVDGDQFAELILVANNTYNAVADLGEEGIGINSVGSGLRVFKSRNKKAWVKTRPLWNQYAYHATNVSDRMIASSSTPTAIDRPQKTFRQNTLNQFETNCRPRRKK
jgi:outer membrane protein assembly factor BamB